MILNFLKEYAENNWKKRLVIFLCFVVLTVTSVVLGVFVFTTLNDVGLVDVFYDIASNFAESGKNSMLNIKKSDINVLIIMNMMLIISLVFAVYQGISLNEDKDIKLKFYHFSLTRGMIHLSASLVKLIELIVYDFIVCISLVLAFINFDLSAYLVDLLKYILVSSVIQLYLFGVSLIRTALMKSENAVIASTGTIVLFFALLTYFAKKFPLFSGFIKIIVPPIGLISLNGDVNINNSNIGVIIGSIAYFILFAIISTFITEKQKDFDK